MNNRKEVLEQLYKLWEQYPHLRFFQLIDLIQSQLGDTYYISNQATISSMKIMSQKFNK